MATATAPPQTVAGHPIAMKVGGRRLSVSKSPPVKSYLSTSPTATKDNTTHETTDYPRPSGGETKEEDKDKQRKEEKESKREKPAFDAVKQKIHNNNPSNNNHFNLKQPSGKVM